MKRLIHRIGRPGVVLAAAALLGFCFLPAHSADGSPRDGWEGYSFPLSEIPPDTPGMEEGQWRNRFYLGLGGFYAIPSDIDEFTVIAEALDDVSYRCRISPDTGSGAFLGLKGGYFLVEDFTLEALLRYHIHYRIKGDYSDTRQSSGFVDEVTASARGELWGWDFSLNPKYFILRGDFRPYLTAGLGYMFFRREADIETNVRTTNPRGEEYENPQAFKLSKSRSGIFSRVAAGCAWFFSDRYGLELELDYTFGLGDVDEMRIFSLGVNALMFF